MRESEPTQTSVGVAADEVLKSNSIRAAGKRARRAAVATRVRLIVAFRDSRANFRTAASPFPKRTHFKADFPLSSKMREESLTNAFRVMREKDFLLGVPVSCRDFRVDFFTAAKNQPWENPSG